MRVLKFLILLPLFNQLVLATDWATCSSEHQDDYFKIKNCFQAKDNSTLYVESKYFSSSSAQMCQEVFNLASKNSWKQVSLDLYNTGFSGQLDLVRATAIHLHRTKKEEVNELDIDNSLKAVFSCVQVASAFGQNFQEDRDEKDAYLNGEKVSSIDEKITCKTMGLETLDYDECSKLVLAQNASILGEAGLKTYQQFEAQDFTWEQQKELMDLDPASNVTTAALKTQKDGLKKQEEMSETRKTAHITKATAIAAASTNIPNSDRYFEEKELCERPVTNAFNTLKSVAKNGQLINQYTPLDLCKINFSLFAFYVNGSAKRSGYLIAGEAGVDAVAEHMIAESLEDQQKLVESAIGKIEGYETIELPEEFFTNQDVYMKFCEANPTHSECGMPTSLVTNVPSFGDYKVGGFGVNNSYKNENDSPVSVAASAKTNDPQQAGVDTSTVVTKAKGSSGGIPNSATPASVSEGGMIAQGSGGGGSSPGGGGGSGGSSPNQGAVQEGKTQSLAGGTKSLSYNGGASPSFVRGGSLRNKKTNKANANPFSGLFEKEKARSIGSLNFEKGVSSKDTNLFERISSAYENAKKQGSLLKYELK